MAESPFTGEPVIVDEPRNYADPTRVGTKGLNPDVTTVHFYKKAGGAILHNFHRSPLGGSVDRATNSALNSGHARLGTARLAVRSLSAVGSSVTLASRRTTPNGSRPQPGGATPTGACADRSEGRPTHAHHARARCPHAKCHLPSVWTGAGQRDHADCGRHRVPRRDLSPGTPLVDEVGGRLAASRSTAEPTYGGAR